MKVLRILMVALAMCALASCGTPFESQADAEAQMEIVANVLGEAMSAGSALAPKGALDFDTEVKIDTKIGDGTAKGTLSFESKGELTDNSTTMTGTISFVNVTTEEDGVKSTLNGKIKFTSEATFKDFKLNFRTVINTPLPITVFSDDEAPVLVFFKISLAVEDGEVVNSFKVNGEEYADFKFDFDLDASDFGTQGLQ